MIADINSINQAKIKILSIIFLFLLGTNEVFGQHKNSRDFDPDDPPEATIPIAPYLKFGGQIEFEYEHERNIDLDGDNTEDESKIETGLTLAFSFDPTENFQAFFAGKYAFEFQFLDGDNTDNRDILEIEQAYILISELLTDNFSFQLGRQRFEDEREWLYDEELDAARVFYDYSNITFEFSISRLNLFDRDLLNKDDEKNINNYGFYALYEFEDEENDREYIHGIYALYRDDKTMEDEDPVFIGIHSEGDVLETLSYWLEFAYVFGESGSEDISAFGFDIGLIYEFDLPLEPSITLSYAFGSGDSDTEDNTDKNFRQSGLHNNESSYNGVPDFKYYGEVFDPELSNLSILSAGIGINFTEETSFDVVYHYFHQHKLSDSFRDSGLDADPNGIDKSIGNEIDIIAGYEGKQGIEFAVKFGYFIPGDAFPSEFDNALTARMELQYEF